MRTLMQGAGVSVQAPFVPRVGRVTRRPVHTWHLRSNAFSLQPCMIAPVLAGETLKNMLFQARVVTDPIKNPLIGWWKEYYFFYVKLTDLDEFLGVENTQATALTSMLLNNPNWVPASSGLYQATANQYAYRATETQDYVTNCLRLITREYFRNEDETASTALDANGLPRAAITNTTFIDSLILQDNVVRPDVNVDLNANATITASEVDEALRRYQWARSNGLTDMSYEDYLASFTGGNPEITHVVGRPELLRYVRQWSYPTNTVEPTTGVPSSAVSWSIQERADKDRYFKEPGFVFGVSLTRPKVYLSGLKGNAAGFMDRALDWLPAHLRADAWSAMKQYLNGKGPVSGITDTDGYWFDIRDLFMYGDQFTNVALTDAAMNFVALPDATAKKRYPSTADIDALFVTPASKQFIREDGTCNLTILGTQMDYTGTT